MMQGLSLDWSAMKFFSMGMFIIDEVHWDDRSEYNVLGGAGPFAALGAGFFLDPQQRTQASCMIDMGNDFPLELRQQLDSWKMGFVYRQDDSRKTTRAWNKYIGREERLFKYLSPSLRIEAADLLARPELAHSKSLHLICSPPRCLEIVSKLQPKDQIVIWEPVPTACTPADWPGCKECFDNVDVLSPNAKEAAEFLGIPEPETKAEIEKVAEGYVDFKGLLVIRSGALGCLAVRNDTKKWYNAYHLDSAKVIDPTGGGNSFLGGLGIGLVEADDETALVYANVASGLMIEQLGFPTYDSENDLWNGTSIADRVALYRQREGLEQPAPE